jgi:hypothetical protein
LLQGCLKSALKQNLRIHHMNTSGGQAGRTEMKVVRLESGGGPAVRQ